MTFDEQGEQLIVRHRARVAYLRYLGLIAIFLLPCSMIMVVARVMSPVQIAIACDRAANECTGSPVQAGWQPVTFPLSDLPKVHLEQPGGQSVIYLGEGSAGHYQLSDVADSPQTAAALGAAVDQAHAFAASNEPTFRVTFPAGKPGVPYYALVATFAFALVWLTQVLRAPRSLELIVDRAKRELTIHRAFVRRHDVQTHGFDTLAKIVCRGGQANPLLSTVSLVLKDSRWVPLVDETSFTAAKAEAVQLTQKLSSFAGIAAEGI